MKVPPTQNGDQHGTLFTLPLSYHTNEECFGLQQSVGNCLLGYHVGKVFGICFGEHVLILG
ncbi:hypothetical protein, partial [Acinetobacter baumannii]|uniref:hypothetical protein n=1 Tax=Acinetobacter baumannii TaxID=470 RepID=UPI001C066163